MTTLAEAEAEVEAVKAKEKAVEAEAVNPKGHKSTWVRLLKVITN